MPGKGPCSHLHHPPTRPQDLTFRHYSLKLKVVSEMYNDEQKLKVNVVRADPPNFVQESKVRLRGGWLGGLQAGRGLGWRAEPCVRAGWRVGAACLWRPALVPAGLPGLTPLAHPSLLPPPSPTHQHRRTCWT